MDLNVAVLRMIDAIDAEGIRYMLVGSFSSNFYGIPRSTRDSDIVVDLAGNSLEGVRRRVGDEFEFDPQMSFESVTGTIRTVVAIRNTPFKIELFRLSTQAHDQERFSRRRKLHYLGRELWIAGPEDVIITKIYWLAGLNRKKDFEDIRDVMSVQHATLDWAYIRRWTDEHGTTALFEEIRATVPAI